MKIVISEPVSPGELNLEPVTIDVGCRDVVCHNVYCGIGIETPQGHFGIAQRDGGIEVLMNGDLVFSSMEPDLRPPGPAPEEMDSVYVSAPVRPSGGYSCPTCGRHIRRRDSESQRS